MFEEALREAKDILLASTLLTQYQRWNAPDPVSEGITVKAADEITDCLVSAIELVERAIHVAGSRASHPSQQRK